VCLLSQIEFFPLMSARWIGAAIELCISLHIWQRFVTLHGEARFTVSLSLRTAAGREGRILMPKSTYLLRAGEIKISTTAVPVQSRQDHKKYIHGVVFAGKSD
jgi:hypothetical protein